MVTSNPDGSPRVCLVLRLSVPGRSAAHAPHGPATIRPVSRGAIIRSGWSATASLRGTRGRRPRRVGMPGRRASPCPGCGVRSRTLARDVLATGAHLPWPASSPFRPTPADIFADGSYGASVDPARSPDGPAITVWGAPQERGRP